MLFYQLSATCAFQIHFHKSFSKVGHFAFLRKGRFYNETTNKDIMKAIFFPTLVRSVHQIDPQL